MESTAAAGWPGVQLSALGAADAAAAAPASRSAPAASHGAAADEDMLVGAKLHFESGLLIQ